MAAHTRRLRASAAATCRGCHDPPVTVTAELDGAAVGAVVGVEMDELAVGAGVAVALALLPACDVDVDVDVVPAPFTAVAAALLSADMPVNAPTVAVPSSATPHRSRRRRRNERSRSAGVRDEVFKIRSSCRCCVSIRHHHTERRRYTRSVSFL
jgi:hypothetical protein